MKILIIMLLTCTACAAPKQKPVVPIGNKKSNLVKSSQIIPVREKPISPRVIINYNENNYFCGKK